MKVIESLGNRLERGLVVIGNVILFSMTIAICIDVACRYVLGFSIAVIDELSAILWVWAVYLVAGVVTRHEGHLVADFLSVHYSEKGKRLLKLASRLLMLGYSALIAWAAILMVAAHKAAGTTPPTEVGMPEWIARFCVIIGFVLVFFYTFENLIPSIRAMGRKASDVKPGRPEPKSIKEG